VPRLLVPGDQIELAAEEQPGEHRQVFLKFEAAPPVAPPQHAESPPRKAALQARTALVSSNSAQPEVQVPSSGKRQRVSSSNERTPTDTLTSSLPILPSDRSQGSQIEARVPAAVLNELDGLRDRAIQAESRLAATRNVVGTELRQLEDDILDAHAKLRDAFREHESERERLTQRASQASQDCQRVVKEKLAEAEGRQLAEKKAEAAQRQCHELEIALNAERAKFAAAQEQLRTLREEEATRCRRIAGVISDLQPLVCASKCEPA